MDDSTTIVQTDKDNNNGQDKCPRCGATDIALNTKTGLLRCNFCRHEFEPVTVKGMETDISKLEGEVFGSGTQDINNDSDKNVVTLKCSSCGAEVVIDTAEITQARCHWCRNTLSVNEQVPNGAVPDVVLPFKLTKAEAKQKIEEFVGKRKFYAHPKFVQEFSTDNVMGVYCPYMVVDVNAHASYKGQAEHELRHYTVRSNNSSTTYYDAEVYDVEREFDLTINGLTVESNSDKLDVKASNKTNNIINSIMPFDTENCVQWNANFLRGFTSEKRDINVETLRPLVDAQSKDVARFAANDTMEYYDRGANWAEQNVTVKGQQWKSAYLPIWLYSYQQKTGEKDSVLHYVAVNARTQETMGSVPVYIPKLLGVSLIIEVLSIFLGTRITDSFLVYLPGFVYFALIYMKYRNTNVRHHHETETKKSIFNLRKVDTFIKKIKGVTNSKIKGINSNQVSGAAAQKGVINSLNNMTNNSIEKLKDDPIDAIFGIKLSNNKDNKNDTNVEKK
ncbi:MAG: TFIIB-type zinc ribbon-containing protein [Clostridia bacterium]|nr:TFIIB-type zinc ribbon-containing protein [Clostridia bacterium]